MTIAALVQEWPSAPAVQMRRFQSISLGLRLLLWRDESKKRNIWDLVAARGRVLATDFHASLDLPPFDVSAMDGYALRRSELAGKGPWTCRVGARLAAGQYRSEHLARSIAVRILPGRRCRMALMLSSCRSDAGGSATMSSCTPSHANMKMSVGAARMFAPERRCSRPELCFQLKT